MLSSLTIIYAIIVGIQIITALVVRCKVILYRLLICIWYIVIIIKLLTLIIFGGYCQLFSAEVTITISEVDAGSRRSSLMI
jgi:hypothetical protein